MKRIVREVIDRVRTLIGPRRPQPVPVPVRVQPSYPPYAPYRRYYR